MGVGRDKTSCTASLEQGPRGVWTATRETKIDFEFVNTRQGAMRRSTHNVTKLSPEPMSHSKEGPMVQEDKYIYIYCVVMYI